MGSSCVANIYIEKIKERKYAGVSVTDCGSYMPDDKFRQGTRYEIRIPLFIVLYYMCRVRNYIAIINISYAAA